MMECLLCSTESQTIVSKQDRRGNNLVTVVCDGCGLVFNNPIPDDEQLAKFYAQDYRKSYKGAARPRGRQVIRNFRRVAKHLSTYSDVFESVNTVLDVGAGSGEFIFSVQETGKDVQGIEPNIEYADYCRSDLDIYVQTAQILDVEFDEKSFDLINLSHVLEHLNDPIRYLTALSKWLKDDGILYVEVPNILGYTKVKSKGNLFHFGHIFNFSPWTLRSAGGRCGLVECDETKRRGAAKTEVFFRKSSRKTTPDAALDQHNAKTVVEAIMLHSRQGGSAPERHKFLTKNLRRIEETISSKYYGSSPNIGRSVLEKAKIV